MHGVSVQMVQMAMFIVWTGYMGTDVREMCIDGAVGMCGAGHPRGDRLYPAPLDELDGVAAAWAVSVRSDIRPVCVAL